MNKTRMLAVLIALMFVLSACDQSRSSRTGETAVAANIGIPLAFNAEGNEAGGARLTWDAITSRLYNIYRGTTTNFQDAVLVREGVTTSPQADTDLASGTHYYWLTATDSTGANESVAAGPMAVTIVTPQPEETAPPVAETAPPEVAETTVPEEASTTVPDPAPAGGIDYDALAKAMAPYMNGGNQMPPSSPQGDGGVVTQNPGGDTGTPYNLPPQPQIGHPSLYLETGVPCVQSGNELVCTDVDAHTKNWKVQLLPGTVAIIGGYTVDGVTNGVYKAQEGPGQVDTTVTDGFVAIVISDWSYGEWCFRLSQTHTEPAKLNQPDWARENRNPLDGWAQCEGIPFDTTRSGAFLTPAGGAGNQPPAPGNAGGSGVHPPDYTGVGKTKTFPAGTPVFGYKLVMNGKTYSSCSIANPTSEVTVTDGGAYPGAGDVLAACALQ